MVFSFYILSDLRIPDNCTRYFISDASAYFFDLAANIKNAEKLAHFGFVSSGTVKKAKKNLNDKQVTKAMKLDSLFKIGFEFAGHVLNNYWLVKPNIKAKINNFIKKKFSGDFIIGLQFRFHYLNKEDIQTFIKCALDIENNNKINVSNRKVKWFISTDQDTYIEDLFKRYSDKILRGEGKIGHIAIESDAYERAILDIELLSYCNETILTGGSTFGFIGSLKNQKIPYFVEGRRSFNGCKLLDFNAPARTPIGYSIFR